MITLHVGTLLVLLGVWAICEATLVLAWWDHQHAEDWIDDEDDEEDLWP
jgi:hypothetical protein